MEPIVDTVVLVAIAVLGAALARRLGFVAPLVLLVAGLGLSFVPGLAGDRARAGARADRHPAAAALRRRAGDLGAGVPVQPAPDPAARGRAGRVHRVRRRLRRARAAARRAAGRLRRARRGRRAAGRGRGDGGRPPHRPAPPGRHHPRGREPAQRRDRAGAAAGRDRRAASARRSGSGRSPARWSLAAGGGVLIGALGAIVLRLPAQADQGPAAGQRAVAADPVRGGDRRRAAARLRRGRRRRGRALPGAPDPVR